MPDEVTPNLEGLPGRLAALERRLSNLEAVLQNRSSPPAISGQAASSSVTPVQRPAEDKQTQHSVPSVKPADQPREEDLPFALPVESTAVLQQLQGDVSPKPVAHVDDSQAWPPWEEGEESASGAQFEQTIGLKWAGWIGAIVLVIGIGLGIKFAYDQGWFGHVPVAVRLLMMSLGGFALIAAGEVVYRRINRLSAVGPFGAGIAVLFVVSYAGNVYYSAYSYQTAFFFAILATFLGSAIAIRARLVSIAVLSQIGGQLAPIILSSGQKPGVPLLAYLLTLQVVALLLALWGRSPKWWVLRALSLVATSWWVVVCLSAGEWGKGLSHAVLWFVVLYAAAYQGELLCSAWRGARWVAKLAEGWGTTFSLLVTACLTAVMLYVFYQASSATLRGGGTLLLATLCLLAAALLRLEQNPLVKALTFSYTVQGLALLILFVPVTFSSTWVPLSWGMLGLSFATIAARYRHESAANASVLTWLLALGWLVSDPPNQIWLTVLDHSIMAYSVMAWQLAGVGLALAYLLQADAEPGLPPRPLASFRPWLASIAASLVWIAASLEGLPALGATLALLTWGWVLVALDCAPSRMYFAVHAELIFLFAALKWILADVLIPRYEPGWNPDEFLPVFNPVMGLGLLIAGSLAAATYLRRPTFERGVRVLHLASVPNQLWIVGVATVSLVVLTLGLSFELDRFVERQLAHGTMFLTPPMQLKLFGQTFLWLAFALALALIERKLAYPLVLPWFVVIAVVVKFLAFDLVYVAREAVPVPVFFNLEMLTAAAAAASIWVLQRLIPPGRADVRIGLHAMALLVVLIACTLELDRYVEHQVAQGVVFLTPPAQLKLLGRTLLWLAFAIALALIERKQANPLLLPWLVVIAVAAKFLVFDIAYIGLEGAREAVQVPVFFNLQMLTAASVAASVWVLQRLIPPGRADVPITAHAMALLVVLIASTLEIDRLFATKLSIYFSDSRLASNVAVSLFWSIFAVASVLAGFRFRLAPLRYFGLVLFGVTLLKVGLIDISQVKYGYRVLSLMGLGLVLLTTSVLYGKVSPKLLHGEQSQD